MAYYNEQNDNIIRATRVDLVLNEVSNIITRPLTKSEPKMRISDAGVRESVFTGNSQNEASLERPPHSTSYWVTQSGPKTSTTRQRRCSLQNPAQMYIEYLQKQSFNQDDPTTAVSGRERQFPPNPQEKDTFERPPHSTSYWLTQSDPNYTYQEEPETSAIPHRRKSLQNPAHIYMEYLQNQSYSQEDLTAVLRGSFPKCLASAPTTFFTTTSKTPTETTFSTTGLAMAFSSSAPVSCSPQLNFENAKKDF